MLKNTITREERMKQIVDVFEKDQNKTLKEIGEELGLSQSTISNYLSQYYSQRHQNREYRLRTS